MALAKALSCFPIAKEKRTTTLNYAGRASVQFQWANMLNDLSTVRGKSLHGRTQESFSMETEINISFDYVNLT